ncbi:hypothetical protein GCM10008967_02320 [Bacillus carboniphilus]|uniref:RNA polymerase sigma factor n=1 Tax=Bacillus carboniphilus TaxID=86663 RepID=A0ABP3FF64_9BACI
MHTNHEDQILVEQAKQGDEEAFTHLIEKHRSNAVNWAKMITKDPYIAEDVAQDVLLRSYLHLQNLQQADRFLPWLRNMVKNRAIDYIRKKHLDPNTHETYIESIDESQDPEAVYAARDIQDSLLSLMEYLPERNRQIFEAHFYNQLPPEEIAKTFQMTTANVYNILSRAKMKLRDERFKREIERFLDRRKKNGELQQAILDDLAFHPSYVSLGHIIYELIKSRTNLNLHLSDVMGYTGQAFRIQVSKEVDVSSSYVYDWGWVLKIIADTFQTKYSYIGKPNAIPTPDLLLQSLDLIQHSIELGEPTIVWNLTNYEFGLIYGFDNKKKVLTFADSTHTNLTVPYEKIGRTPVPELFVGTLHVSSCQKPRITTCIENIVNHARGKEPKIDGFTQGLAAYDTWIEAIEGGYANSIGHAYQIALMTEDREHAVHFLGKIASIHNEQPWIQMALSHYKKVHDIFLALYPSFPYGLPGIKMDIKKRTITLLRQAKEHEEKAIENLEKYLLRKSVVE